jgi:hypothetical protein
VRIIRRSITDKIVNFKVIGYSSAIPEVERVHIKPERVHYAFMPVWMLSTKWDDQIYLFAMNGQTGKFIGDLPVDMTKFWLYFLGITVFMAAVMYVVLFIVL